MWAGLELVLKNSYRCVIQSRRDGFRQIWVPTAVGPNIRRSEGSLSLSLSLVLSMCLYLSLSLSLSLFSLSLSLYIYMYVYKCMSKQTNENLYVVLSQSAIQYRLHRWRRSRCCRKRTGPFACLDKARNAASAQDLEPPTLLGTMAVRARSPEYL